MRWRRRFAFSLPFRFFWRILMLDRATFASLDRRLPFNLNFTPAPSRFQR